MTHHDHYGGDQSYYVEEAAYRVKWTYISSRMDQWLEFGTTMKSWTLLSDHTMVPSVLSLFLWMVMQGLIKANRPVPGSWSHWMPGQTSWMSGTKSNQARLGHAWSCCASESIPALLPFKSNFYKLTFGMMLSCVCKKKCVKNANYLNYWREKFYTNVIIKYFIHYYILLDWTLYRNFLR